MNYVVELRQVEKPEHDETLPQTHLLIDTTIHYEVHYLPNHLYMNLGTDRRKAFAIPLHDPLIRRTPIHGPLYLHAILTHSLHSTLPPSEIDSIYNIFLSKANCIVSDSRNTGFNFIPLSLSIRIIWTQPYNFEAQVAWDRMLHSDVGVAWDRMLQSDVSPRLPATDKSVRELETAVYEDDTGLECPICLEEFNVGEEMTRMPCFHYYHADCIVAWLKNSHLCPSCRFPLPNKILHNRLEALHIQLAEKDRTVAGISSVHQRRYSSYARRTKETHVNVNVSERCLLFFYNNNEEDEECLFRPMSLRLPGLACGKDMVGSINGLICLSEGRVDTIYRVAYFILFNPSIGCFLSIPSPSDKGFSYHASTVKGLGFDESTLDYKILYIVDSDCFIYSLNSSSWRKLITPPVLTSPWCCCFPPSVVFVNGRIHWIHAVEKQFGRGLAWPFRFIMVFNLKDDTFCRISLPECFADFQRQPHRGHYGVNNFSILEFGESSFALLHQSQFQADIWVMKEYGSKESWIKFATLHPEAFPHSEGFLRVLGFRNKDQVLTLHTGRSCIVSHNIHNEEEAKNLIYSQDFFCQGLSFSQVYKYVPSLVLLDKENNFDAHVDVDVDVDVTPLATAEIAQSQEQEQ